MHSSGKSLQTDAISASYTLLSVWEACIFGKVDNFADRVKCVYRCVYIQVCIAKPIHAQLRELSAEWRCVALVNGDWVVLVKPPTYGYGAVCRRHIFLHFKIV